MNKIIFSLITVVIVAIAGIGWMISLINEKVYVEKTLLYKDEITLYSEFGQGLANAIESQENIYNTDTLTRHWQGDASITFAIIDIEELVLPAELQLSFNTNRKLILESETEITVYYPVIDHILVMSIPLEVLSQNNSSSLLFTLFFYSCLIFTLILWLSPLLKQLIVLRKSAVSFGTGALETRVPIKRFSYIKQIEMSFNDMAERIEILIHDNKLLSRAVSHDLKTPLARLRFGVDILSENKHTPPKPKYLERLNSDIDEMESLVNTLLQYAKLDETNINLNPSSVNVSELIDLLLEPYTSNTNEFSKKNIVFEKPTVSPILLIDEKYLGMLINNIITNALKFSKKNIIIQLFVSRGKIDLIIEDDGPGIEIAQYSDVVKPFWKNANSQFSGHGMGLAIAERLSQWFNAKLTIDRSDKLGGASFRVVFSTPAPKI